MDLFSKIQSWMTSGLVLLLVAVSGYAMIQDRALDDARRQRDDAVRARQAAERAIVVLADQAAENARIAGEKADGRESIVAAPASEDGPVAPVLQRGLDAADRIGGLK